jgi:hypothetical protein
VDKSEVVVGWRGEWVAKDHVCCSFLQDQDSEVARGLSKGCVRLQDDDGLGGVDGKSCGDLEEVEVLEDVG